MIKFKKNIKKNKKTEVVKFENAVLVITSNKNNIFVAVTQLNGEVISVFSCGTCGFKNSKKGTPYSIKIVGEKAINFLKEIGVRNLSIKLRGKHPSKDQLINHITSFIIAADLTINSIEDVSNIPFGGCRLPNRRKV